MLIFFIFQKITLSVGKCGSGPLSVTDRYISEREYEGCTGYTSLELTGSVATVGNYAFAGCTGLRKITVGALVSSIGEYAFANCTGINTQLTLGQMSSPLEIKEGAFYGCTGIPSLTTTSMVKYIRGYAFYGCTGMTKLNLHIFTLSIGEKAFYGCSGLKGTLNLPSRITEIGELAFGETNFDKVYFSSNPNQIKCPDNIFTHDVALDISMLTGDTFCGVKRPEKTPSQTVTITPNKTPGPTKTQTPARTPIQKTPKPKKKVPLPAIIIPCCVGGVLVIIGLVFSIIACRRRCSERSISEYDPKTIEDLDYQPKTSKYEQSTKETGKPRGIGDTPFD